MQVAVLNMMSKSGHIYFKKIFLEIGSHSVAQAECSGVTISHCGLNILGSGELPAPVSQAAQTTGTHRNTRLLFCLNFVETKNLKLNILNYLR